MRIVGYVFPIPIPSLSIHPQFTHPNYADSTSSEEQIYVDLSVSYLNLIWTRAAPWSCFSYLHMQEDITEEQSINEPLLKLFVVII